VSYLFCSTPDMCFSFAAVLNYLLLDKCYLGFNFSSWLVTTTLVEMKDHAADPER